MINYQQHPIIVKTQFGLEHVLANELTKLGATEVTPINRAVSFKGSKELVYKANLWLRTAISVLIPIKVFTIRNQQDLYDQVKQINWSDFFDVEQTFAIHANVHSDLFKHTQFPALKAKDAIVDQFREQTQNRPSIDINDPDIRINLHIGGNKCTLSLDSSGKTLNKRGYRGPGNKAPLNEVLAAGIISLAGWNGNTDLIDPMCGSGTFSCEAAWIAENIAPGLLVPNFAFKSWKDYDSELFMKLVKEAKAAQTNLKRTILANDISDKTLRNTAKNLQKAGLSGKVKISNQNFFEMSIKPGSTIIINPPYDIRLKTDDINDFYAKMGTALKTNCIGSVAWIIAPDEEPLKHIGLRPSKRISLFNGKLPCKLLKYEMYSGSRKKSKQNQTS